MIRVFNAPREEPFHNVVFCAAHKDRILATGRRRGMQFPYWLETIAKNNYPEEWLPDHTATPYFGPQFKYAKIAKQLRETSFELAPKRAFLQRARP